MWSIVTLQHSVVLPIGYRNGLPVGYESIGLMVGYKDLAIWIVVVFGIYFGESLGVWFWDQVLINLRNYNFKF